MNLVHVLECLGRSMICSIPSQYEKNHLETFGLQLEKTEPLIILADVHTHNQSAQVEHCVPMMCKVIV